jgi:hypothetical protein
MGWAPSARVQNPSRVCFHSSLTVQNLSAYLCAHHWTVHIINTLMYVSCNTKAAHWQTQIYIFSQIQPGTCNQWPSASSTNGTDSSPFGCQHFTWGTRVWQHSSHNSENEPPGSGIIALADINSIYRATNFRFITFSWKYLWERDKTVWKKFRHGQRRSPHGSGLKHNSSLLSQIWVEFRWPSWTQNVPLARPKHGSLVLDPMKAISCIPSSIVSSKTQHLDCWGHQNLVPLPIAMAANHTTRRSSTCVL